MDNLLLIFLAIIIKSSLPSYIYDTKYFTVLVDHFSFTQNDTFQMKYLINDSYWDSTNGPIFLYTGNEGPIEMFCNNTGFVWEIAEEFKALVVFVEHRYYGVSMPYGKDSFDDKGHLGYLTSQQVLADFVNLIEHLRQKPRDKSPSTDSDEYDDQIASCAISPNPVIAFGGSYGGILSAWLRMKYPASAAGAIASSAPILQIEGCTPCNAFYRKISSVYMATSKECGETIRSSWKAIDNVTATDEGKKWLSQQWKLCWPLKNSTGVARLKGWTKEVYVNMAMANYPYPANFLTPLPGNPIKKFCKPLTNSQSDYYTLLSSVFEGLNVYFNYTGSAQCLDLFPKASATPSLGGKGWTYQTCTELIMPMCSDGIEDIFEKSPWNFTGHAQWCYNQYGVNPPLDLAKKTYGGKNLYAASNIIFGNGLLDPWSSGGVMHSISNNVQAVIMPEAAHHLDLRSSNPEDPKSVIEARKYYKESIKRWIDCYRKNKIQTSYLL